MVRAILSKAWKTQYSWGFDFENRPFNGCEMVSCLQILCFVFYILDKTAWNFCFELREMAPFRELATMPFPSFEMVLL